MHSFSVWHWIIVLFVLLILLIPVYLGARICKRAGYSRLWAISQLFPIVGAVFIWVFAFSNWPVLAGDVGAGSQGKGA